MMPPAFAIYETSRHVVFPKSQYWNLGAKRESRWHYGP